MTREGRRTGSSPTIDCILIELPSELEGVNGCADKVSKMAGDGYW